MSERVYICVHIHCAMMMMMGEQMCVCGCSAQLELSTADDVHFAFAVVLSGAEGNDASGICWPQPEEE